MKRRRTIAVVIWALYVCAVLVLLFGKFSSSPDIPKEVLGIPLDKVVHVLLFLPSVILTYMTFYQRDLPQSKVLALFIWTIVSAAGLAAMSELTQNFLPWRSGDPADFAADVIGIFLSVAIALTVHRKITIEDA